MKKIKLILRAVIKGILLPLKGVKALLEIIGERPVITGVLLLGLLGFLVINASIKRGHSYNPEDHYIDNILIEAHGLLFDIFIFGVLIVIFNRIGERRREIKRYEEEIDDFRGWDEKEATYRIVGNIKRLNKRGITQINISFCYLARANLLDAKLREAHLWGTNLDGANLRGANLTEADLWKTTGLKGEQLVEIKTLYQTKLHPHLLAWVWEKFPHLLEKPKPEKEGQKKEE